MTSTSKKTKRNAGSRCAEGHDITGDKLYIDPKGYRVCKECRDNGTVRNKLRNATDENKNLRWMLSAIREQITCALEGKATE